MGITNGWGVGFGNVAVGASFTASISNYQLMGAALGLAVRININPNDFTDIEIDTGLGFVAGFGRFVDGFIGDDGKDFKASISFGVPLRPGGPDLVTDFDYEYPLVDYPPGYFPLHYIGGPPVMPGTSANGGIGRITGLR